MFWDFAIRYRQIVAVLGVMLLGSACAPAVQPTPTSTPTPAATSMPEATPLPEIELARDLPEGSVEGGNQAAIKYFCQGCHNPLYPTAGPALSATDDLPGIMARGEIRIASPDYQGKAATNQEYLIESILLPAAYFVPGEWARKMPTHYLDQVTDQELADLLVWIAAQE